MGDGIVGKPLCLDRAPGLSIFIIECIGEEEDGGGVPHSHSAFMENCLIGFMSFLSPPPPPGATVPLYLG